MDRRVALRRTSIFRISDMGREGTVLSLHSRESPQSQEQGRPNAAESQTLKPVSLILWPFNPQPSTLNPKPSTL